MWIRFLQPLTADGADLKPGDLADCTPAAGRRLIEQGKAVEATADEVQAVAYGPPAGRWVYLGLGLEGC